MSRWARAAFGALAALALLAALSGGLARASGLGIDVADPPFAVAVSCPPADGQPEGTVPCS